MKGAADVWTPVEVCLTITYIRNIIISLIKARTVLIAAISIQIKCITSFWGINVPVIACAKSVRGSSESLVRAWWAKYLVSVSWVCIVVTLITVSVAFNDHYSVVRSIIVPVITFVLEFRVYNNNSWLDDWSTTDSINSSRVEGHSNLCIALIRAVASCWLWVVCHSSNVFNLEPEIGIIQDPEVMGRLVIRS